MSHVIQPSQYREVTCDSDYDTYSLQRRMGLMVLLLWNDHDIDHPYDYIRVWGDHAFGFKFHIFRRAKQLGRHVFIEDKDTEAATIRKPEETP